MSLKDNLNMIDDYSVGIELKYRVDKWCVPVSINYVPTQVV